MVSHDLRVGAYAASVRSSLRRVKRCAARFAAVFTGLMAAAEPAAAQSLLGTLFGWDHQPSNPASVAPTRPPVPETHAAAAHQRDDVSSPSSQHTDFEHAARTRGSDGGSVQTMCVRTCDGFYWPLHFPAARHDLKAEEALCQATCGAETKLYTRADPGVEAEEMVDADGHSYGASPTAFAYRKGLTNGCTCRPMPWSGAERARHEAYALVEAEKKLRAEQAEAERVAAVAAVADAAKAWGRDVAWAALKPVEAEVATVAALGGGPFEAGPQIGPLEEQWLRTRRLPEVSSEAALEEDPPAPSPPPSSQPQFQRRVQSGEQLTPPGRRSAGDGRVPRPARAPGGQVAPSKTGLLAWLPGPSKYTYPGDPPGR